MTDIRQDQDTALADRFLATRPLLAGTDPKFRGVHAEGIGFRGILEATGAGARYTKARFLQPNAKNEIFGRFSLSSNNPQEDDSNPGGLGMAIAMGEEFHSVCINLNFFPLKDKQSVIEQAELQAAEGMLTKLGKGLSFLYNHPQSLCPMVRTMYRMSKRPTSYTQQEYNSVHAFLLENDSQEVSKIKFIWKPHRGIEYYNLMDIKPSSPDYLSQEFSEILAASGPVYFDLYLQLGIDEDPTNNISVTWPQDREMVNVALLTIVDLIPNGTAEKLNFNPTRLPDGIRVCADDELILFRGKHVYPLSQARRKEASEHFT